MSYSSKLVFGIVSNILYSSKILLENVTDYCRICFELANLLAKVLSVKNAKNVEILDVNIPCCRLSKRKMDK